MSYMKECCDRVATDVVIETFLERHFDVLMQEVGERLVFDRDATSARTCAAALVDWSTRLIAAWSVYNQSQASNIEERTTVFLRSETLVTPVSSDRAVLSQLLHVKVHNFRFRVTLVDADVNELLIGWNGEQRVVAAKVITG